MTTTDDEDEALLQLGPCCACRGEEGVINVIMLKEKAPVAGTGWGCAICGLPSDGAVAVLCTRCVVEGTEILEACKGYPSVGVRVPIGELTGLHDHDWSKHAEEHRTPGDTLH